jgi:hypothetical protein
MLEVIIRPQSPLLLIRHFLPKYLAQLLKVPVHAGVPPNHCHNASVAMQGAQGTPKIIWGHFPKRILVLQ